MPNSLTIHFHIKHFRESGLPFSEYTMLLMYEQREDWTVIDFKDMFHLSERTVNRMRGSLMDGGFLKKVKGNGRYSLTNKLYADDTKRF
jgi:predicted transcriptional regulator